MDRTSGTRLLIRLFVVSVVINAVLGIWALVSGEFGETEGKILATSFLVSASMLSVLVNSPAIGRRTLWPAPGVGAVAGAAGFVLFIALLWAEADDEFWFKLAGTLLVAAAAATLAASLALLSVPAAYRWLPTVGHGLIAVLAVTVILGVWFEPDNEWYARLVGVEAVLVAAFTLLVPVLSRFAASSAQSAEPGDEPLPVPAVRFCPSCGRPVTPTSLGPASPSTCARCGLAFTVDARGQGDPIVAVGSGRVGDDSG